MLPFKQCLMPSAYLVPTSVPGQIRVVPTSPCCHPDSTICCHTYAVFLTQKNFSTTISISRGSCQVPVQEGAEIHLRQVARGTNIQTTASSKPPWGPLSLPTQLCSLLQAHLDSLWETAVTHYKKDTIPHLSTKRLRSRNKQLRGHKTRLSVLQIPQKA